MGARFWFSVWLTILPAMVAAQADPPPLSEVSIRSPRLAAAVAAAQAAMRAELAKHYPADQLVARVERGPFGTVVAVMAYPEAAAGSGIMRQMIDGSSGISYGLRGRRSFADFAREHGWLASPPPADELLGCLNIALFEGIAVFDANPAVTVGTQGLRIEATQRYVSGGDARLVVTVPRSGAERVARTPLE